MRFLGNVLNKTWVNSGVCKSSTNGIEFSTLPWKSMEKKPAGYPKLQNFGKDLNDLLNLVAALFGGDSSVKAHRLLACTTELSIKMSKRHYSLRNRKRDSRKGISYSVIPGPIENLNIKVAFSGKETQLEAQDSFLSLEEFTRDYNNENTNFGVFFFFLFS